MMRVPDITTYETRACVKCGKTSLIVVYPSKLKAWQDGALIQSVWPEMSADERELMQTGIHAACWEAMFPDDET